MNGFGTLGLLLPGIAGALGLLAGLRLRGQAWPIQSLALVLGSVLGLGLASIPLPIVVVYGGGWPSWWPWAELTAWLLLSIALTWVWLKSPPGEPIPLPSIDWRISGPMLALFLVALLSCVLTITYMMQVKPHGEWDAMHIWNFHARFLARDQGQHWRNMMVIDDHHAEYPLMLPSTIARFWSLDQHESQVAPQLFAILLAAGMTAVMVLSLRLTRGLSVGLLAGSFWLAPAWVGATVAALYADIPLACWMICALGVWSVASPNNLGRVAIVSGLFAGLAAWTKNEGLPFTILLALGLVLWTWRTSRLTGLYYTLGAVGPVLLNVWWKLQCPNPNDLIAGQQSPLGKLVDLQRWQTLVEAAWSQTRPQYGIALLVVGLVGVVLGVARQRPGLGLVALAVAVAQGAAYLLTLILTPHEVLWHVNTSVNRLVLHLWPMLLWGGFSLMQSPEERLRGHALIERTR